MKNLVEFAIPDDKIICDLYMDQVGLSAVAVADEFDLFRIIGSEPQDAATLAAKINSDKRAVEVLLNALVTQGGLANDDGKYSLTTVGDAFFKRGSPLCRIFQLYSNKESWAYKRISNMMKNGPDPVAFGKGSYTSMWETGTLTQEAADRFTAMMNTNIGAVAIAVAKSGIFADFTSVVDVGGASGIFLAAMRQLHPEMKLTLFELPQVCESAKGILKHYVDPTSIEYFPASFFEQQWPANGQAYFLSNVLHDWPRAKGVEILKNIRQALPSNGAVFINEALLNEDRMSPKYTVLFDLMMHLNHASQQYTEVELFEILHEAGFKNPRRVFEFGYYSTIRADV
ncbi:methyltransferase [Bdellovibrio sp. HCB290]|uniref:methyltransferase n=1 Tax=Bdellovibrio sp. HCB290 TaxID=3394356 RepID=UPI0039B6AACF